MLQFWILTALVWCVTDQVFGNFDANFTLQNVWSRLPQPGLRSMIQCISSDESPNRIKFTRKLDTGKGSKLPKYSQQFLQGKPIFASIFLMPSEDKLNRFGAYQCRTISKQLVPTEIVTLKLPPLDLAEFDAANPYLFANQGDDVDLEVNVLKQLDLPIRWRYNGKIIPAWNDKLKVQLKAVKKAEDEGIYECYYEGRRGESVHAILRLVVRSCPENLYGDQCDQECPVCDNGGVCHDQWGVCVCPAGFTGTTCDLACGGNHFGADCSRLCTPPQNNSNMDEGCALHLFCKPDPYGCSCAPGFKGSNCMDHCEPGWYGADCKQPCHCAHGVSSCNRITGHCEGGCARNWRGNSCQIHDPDGTSNDFIETTTMAYCPVGSYGPSCEKSCHCSRNEMCDVITGKCPSGCEEGWGSSSCSVCIDGRFGENCEFKCHCEGGHYNCDKDGYCYSGCKAGWAGFTCQQECTPGRFGPNCASTCHCKDGQSACDKINGTCIGDCESGYMADDCQTLCPLNMYGVNCANNCICSNGGQCNRLDGTCACNDRWRGLACNESEPQIVAATDEEVNVGQQLFISCTADAVPKPEMNMSCSAFLGLPFNIRTLDQNQYQAVMKVKAEKSGKFDFICTAMNRHGFDMRIITLSVIESPRLVDKLQLVEKSNDTIKIKWREWVFEKDIGGKISDKIDYQVVYRESGASDWEKLDNWRTTLTATLYDLVPNRNYEIAVKCRRRDKGGEGDVSPILAVKTDCGSPTPDGVPQQFLPDKISQTEVTLSWKPPAETMLHCQLTSYSLSYHLEDDDSVEQILEITNVSNSVTLEGLIPNSAYVLHLHPITSVERSKYFAELIINTTETVPGPVRNLEVMPVEEPDLLLVSWEEPLVGFTKSYFVTYDLIDRGQCGTSIMSSETSGKRHIHSTDTEVTLQNLFPYSSYNVTVRAKNSAGEGDPTTAVSLTSESGPDVGPPNVRVISSTSTSLHFQWDPIPCESKNGDIIKFEYALVTSELTVSSAVSSVIRQKRFSDIELGTSFVAVEGLDALVDGLLPYVEYGFAVRGHTRVEPGPFTEFLFHRTDEEIPDHPRALAVMSASPNHLLVSWSKPVPPNGYIIQYRIQLWNHRDSEMGADVIYNTTELDNEERRISYTVDHLKPATDYFIKIKASTSIGWGEWSSLISGRTTDDVPGAPSEISLLDSEEEALRITWSSPATRNGAILEYKVSYRSVSSLDPLFSTETIQDMNRSVSNKSTEIYLEHLQPSTQYNITVRARTSAGYGPPSSFLAWTIVLADHISPSVKTVDADTTNDTISIIFSTAKSSTVYKYQVIVEHSRHTGPIDENLLSGYETAVVENGLPYYIAAELDPQNVSYASEQFFVVGDRNVWGGYTNVHLNPGHKYKIRIRTLFKKDDVVKSILSEPRGHAAETSVFQVDHRSAMKILGMDMFVFVLVIISIIIFIIIASFITSIILCTKRHKKKSTTSFSVQESGLSESLTWSVMYKVPENEAADGPLVSDSLKFVHTFEKNASLKKTRNDSKVNRGIRIDCLSEYMNNSNTSFHLAEEYKRIVSGQTSHWTAARKNENLKKNRYGNILPYDRNRVILHSENSKCDYVNASYIDGYRRPKEYIVTQGPLQNTISDFWNMVWQENSPIIIMVTDLVENGKAKCTKYWPDDSMVCDNMQILLIHQEESSDFITRTLLIRKMDEGSTHRVIQYQFTDWPDRTVPSNPSGMLKMLNKIRSDHPVMSGPMIVHCSAGAGRSCVCITLDALCQQAEEEKRIDVFRFVNAASHLRINFIQSLEQYVFIYEALLEAVQYENTTVPLEDIGIYLRQLNRSSTLDRRSLIAKQFDKLNRTQKNADVNRCSVALSESNIFKNRDPMTVPVDFERIKLVVDNEESDGSDYINAVLVDGYRKQRSYLVTQMPMQHTVEDFWRMIYQHKSSLILMLNGCDETDDLNVGIYWPDRGESSYGDFDVELVSVENQDDVTIRSIKLTDNYQAPEVTQEVIQVQYKTYLSDVKPASLISLLEVVDLHYLRSDGGPITIHCMDGATQCGLFLANSFIRDQIRAEGVLDAYQVVKAIRCNRTEFIPNLDQFRMCFEVAQELSEPILQQNAESDVLQRKVSIKI